MPSIETEVQRARALRGAIDQRAVHLDLLTETDAPARPPADKARPRRRGVPEERPEAGDVDARARFVREPRRPERLDPGPLGAGEIDRQPQERAPRYGHDVVGGVASDRGGRRSLRRA